MKEPYDLVIIGSGAAGGILAKRAVEQGMNVAMLEAGPLRDKNKDFPYHQPFPYEDPYRKPKESVDLSKYLFVKNADEPYTAPQDKPFTWTRARNVGGRTLFWGRRCLRFNEWDFKGRSRDGQGEDWPISYQEIAPYYDLVEQFIGVTGVVENHPDVPDGKFLPPVALKCGDHIIKRACEKMGIRVIYDRRAMLTRAHGGFAKCHFCSACDKGCETDSFFNSAYRVIVPLQKKYPNNFTLISNAMARAINVDDRGLAKSVSYIDKRTGADREITGRAIAVAAGCLESTRLLLLSKSSRFPNGLANSSGQVGKNFIEHLTVGVRGYLTDISFAKPYDGDGIGSTHINIPWFGWDRPKNSFNFVRGYQIELGSAGFRLRLDKDPKGIPGFGADFKREVRRWYGTTMNLKAFAEMLPHPDNFVELDPKVVDKWGLPVLKIQISAHENELAMTKHIYETLEEIFHHAKGVELRKGPYIPGDSIHEMGTCRMGSDPKSSVLNRFQQAHDVKNLFVVDAASFTSGSHKNPTLTIMALAWRTGDYIVEEMKKGNL